jgi:tetratricopeptide (TPR) repeat protein
MLHYKIIARIFKTARGLPSSEPSLNDLMGYEKAQDLCYQAWNSEKNEALSLAWEAVELSPLCSDAYNVFAEYLAEDYGERLLFYRWAMRIGETYFGKRFFDEEKGCFYGLVKTRPYMRARYGVAMALRNLGCYEEAIGHLEGLISLDEGDHLGARLVLMVAYLELSELDKAKKLIDRHRDNAGPYAKYSEVVWCWLSRTSDEQFKATLAAALKCNQFVPGLLEHPKQEIERSPCGVGWERADGAEEYLLMSEQLWNLHPELKKKVIAESKRLLPKVLQERDEEWARLREKFGLKESE